jgi:hypothetical protein
MVTNPTVQVVDFTDGQIVLSMSGAGERFSDPRVDAIDMADVAGARVRKWMRQNLSKPLRDEMEIDNVRRAESTFGVGDVEVIISR